MEEKKRPVRKRTPTKGLVKPQEASPKRKATTKKPIITQPTHRPKNDGLVPTIEVPPLSKWLNPAFVPLWNNGDRRIIMYGSRGSGKSDYTAKRIMLMMLEDSNFRGLCLRRDEEQLRESSFKTIVENIIGAGLEKFFSITTSPLKIKCTNGADLIFKGWSDPTKIKSVTNLSFLWWEEDICDTEEQYSMISASIRSMKAVRLQEYFTINPAIPDYQNHWFWKRYFDGELDLSFRKEEVSVMDGVRMTQYSTIHHSTWRDNLIYLKKNPDFGLQFEVNRLSNPYLYSIESLGRWANKIANNQYYKKFSAVKNVEDFKYRPDLPLHFSFDFNKNPFMTCTIYQTIGKDCYMINELCLANPFNSTKSICDRIKRDYSDHESGCYIYGDATGYAKSTAVEEGINNYTIIFKELSKYRPTDRTTRSNPSQKMRGDFINDIFDSHYNDCGVWISPHCKNTLNDLLVGPELEDGSKDKKTKTRDKVTGITYEKYHHCSDSLDYFLCSYFVSDYEKYKRSGIKTHTYGKLPVNNRNRTNRY